MFGWFGSKLKAENEALRQQLATKSASGDALIASSAGPMGLGIDQVGLTQNREQLLHYRGWAYVCIKAIAQRCASQDVFVGRTPTGPTGPRTEKSIGNDIEPLPTHELIEAIHDPNDVLVRWSLIFITVASLELTGKAFWWLKFDDAGKLRIYPLPSHWMTPIHNGNKLFAQWKCRPDGAADAFTLEGEEVAYFHLPDPMTPLGAVSPLQSQARAVYADEHIQLAQDAAFANGINPGVILTAGRLPGVGGGPGLRPILTPEQRKQLIVAIQNAYRGVLKNGEAMIVDGLIESITKFTNTPLEMDFLNSGKQTKSRIFQAFGVNPLIVGEIEGANRAQAVVAEESFCNNVVNPILTLLGQVLTAWVAPRLSRPGEKLTVWFDPCKARDDETTFKQWSLAATRGFVTPNEYRKYVLNLPAIDGGDTLPQAAPAMPAMGAKRLKLPAAFDPTLNPYSLKSLRARVNGQSH
jgi:phage portal protein BeeE